MKRRKNLEVFLCFVFLVGNRNHNKKETENEGVFKGRNKSQSLLKSNRRAIKLNWKSHKKHMGRLVCQLVVT